MAAKHDELIGQRFGSLIVKAYIGRTGTRYKYLCKCDCGKEKNVDKYNLISGHTKSCGCQSKYRKRPGQETRQARTTYLTMEELQKQNVTISEAAEPGRIESLCYTCTRSAAPPSIRCIWDESKAKQLPDGAEVIALEARSVSKSKKSGKEIVVKVLDCPLYLDIRIPENKALLEEERQKNKK